VLFSPSFCSGSLSFSFSQNRKIQGLKNLAFGAQTKEQNMEKLAMHACDLFVHEKEKNMLSSLSLPGTYNYDQIALIAFNIAVCFGNGSSLLCCIVCKDKL
jgi:hypothetical protein|tara:strand:- start:85 stop:387 length:303 start_codon:yes stop_codon:yes gene_type:complete